MGLTLDFSADWEVWDNIERVELLSVSRGSDEPTAIRAAVRSTLTAAEAQASYGVYRKDDVKWTIPGVMLSGVTPKPRDVILDANSNRYTILDAAFEFLDGGWELTTRNLVISEGLDQTMTVQEAAVTYDGSGGAVRSWSTLYSGVACRAQPQELDIADERSLRAQQTRYLVFCERQLPNLDVRECRLVIAGVGTLDVIRATNPERIDELFTVEAILKA